MVLNGRYELRRRLGSGGIGVVHEARDRILGEAVALKILHPHLRNHPAVLDAFRREVAVSRLLDHPAVARIHDMGEDPVTRDVYLAMEYLPGGDLKRRILTGWARAPSAVRELAASLLGALAAAHPRGVVHRDIKPHNILFDAAERARLADFGLARLGGLVGLDEASRVVGTPEYLAPESVESGYADARSDLYSLGVVLYEAATGHLPFAAGSVYEVLRMQASVEAPPLPEEAPGYDPGLARVIGRLLEKDPSRRFQTAQDAAAALEQPLPPAAPERDPDHPCPVCGAPVPDAFPYCFACRREPLILDPAPAGTRRWMVLVTGPGKPGDQLSHPQRARCLELVRDTGVDTRRLERRLPRVPFVLVRGLEEEGARRLARALEGRGLASACKPERRGGSDRATRALVLRKDLLLSARAVGILAASVGGSLGSMGGRIFQRGGWVWFVAVLAALFVVAPVATIIRNRLPELRWRAASADRGRAEALARYLELAPRVASPPLQALARRIVLRYEALGRMEGEVPLARDAAPLVLRAADWIEACQGVVDRLERTDERGIYRRIADLRDDSPGGHEETMARNERALDRRRELERTRAVLLDRILTFSARLDALVVNLASRGAHAARREVADLERAAEDAALTVGAIRVVEEEGAS